MTISAESASALGDIRAAGPGDVITVIPGARARTDWGRYLDALVIALSRGADVVWVR